MEHFVGLMIRDSKPYKKVDSTSFMYITSIINPEKKRVYDNAPKMLNITGLHPIEYLKL